MALKAGRVGVRKDQVDNNGIIDMSNVPTELPTYTASDEGKMLTVDSSGDLEFANVPTEIPSHSSSDEGKVLSVDSSGGLEFTSISGGEKIKKITFTTTGNISGGSKETYTISNIPNGYTPISTLIDNVGCLSNLGMFSSNMTLTVYALSGNTIVSGTKVYIYCVKDTEIEDVT